MSQYGVFSGPYFPVFGLNTDEKKLRIWTLFTQWRGLSKNVSRRRQKIEKKSWLKRPRAVSKNQIWTKILMTQNLMFGIIF